MENEAIRGLMHKMVYPDQFMGTCLCLSLTVYLLKNIYVAYNSETM